MAREIYNGRTIEIYLDSPELKQKIKDEAKERNCSISKYISSALENAKQQPRPDPCLSQDLNALREENQGLRRSLAECTRDNDRLSHELQKLRNEAFLRPAGDVTLDPELLQTRQAGPIHSHRLLDALGIDPVDAEAVQAITRQLEDLERTGFIARGARGWRWLK